MKFILKQPNTQQLDDLKKLDIYVYTSENDVYYVDLPNISSNDLCEGPIDLGLSVKWASCNIGALKPCDPGLLFQFGRVDGYKYGDTNNKFRTISQNIEDTGDEYIPISTSGTSYDMGDNLILADDAAYVWSMGEYRMPTKDELYELVNNTTNTWCTCTELDEHHEGHTVLGRLFVSKVDELKKMFIPTCGYYNAYSCRFYGIDTDCSIWASTVHETNEKSAYYLYIDVNECSVWSDSRRCGCSIRGVC